MMTSGNQIKIAALVFMMATAAYAQNAGVPTTGGNTNNTLAAPPVVNTQLPLPGQLAPAPTPTFPMTTVIPFPTPPDVFNPSGQPMTPGSVVVPPPNQTSPTPSGVGGAGNPF